MSSGYLGAMVNLAPLWWAIGIAAGITVGAAAGIWAALRWRRRRKLARHRAGSLEQSERLWRDFDRTGATHQATGMGQHGAGAVRYFAARTHSHPFPPPRGYRCPAADCNWPRR